MGALFDLLADVNRKVCVHRYNVVEVLANVIASVTGAHDELLMTIVRKCLHDVPEDWFATHRNHGLWPKLGFFSKACTQSTSQ
jgi:hypothetical protein